MRNWIRLGIAICMAMVWTLPPGTARAETLPPVEDTADFVPGQLVVGLQPGVESSALLLPQGVSLMSAAGELAMLNAVVLQVPVGQELALAEQMRGQPGVRYAEPNYIVRADWVPNDPLWLPSSYSPLGQYGPQLVQAPAAWDTTTGSASVTIAIIDSGIDASHPEFAGRLVQGYDFIQKDATPQDLCGHGTHTAGIAAASGNNGMGVAGLDWNAKIMPVRVLNQYCSGNEVTLSNGLVFAANHGADVINLSLGLGIPTDLVKEATYYAYQHGAALFASSGNSGLDRISYPARYPWMLAVGAVDSTSALAWFSNYGVDLDVVGPGVDVLSTTPMSGSFYYQSVLGTTNQYGILSGTSMAAPHVTGTAALLLAAHPELYSTPDMLYQALTATAKDLGAPGWDSKFGYGLVQAANALNYQPQTPQPSVISYDYARSDQCNGVAFDWIELSKTPALFLPGNDQTLTLPLPDGFNFEFAGFSYPAVRISTNGYVEFGDFQISYPPLPVNDPVGSNLFDNYPIPAATNPTLFAAPYWDDLTPSARVDSRIFASTLGSAPNRKYVVEWYRVARTNHEEEGSVLTFEMVLYESTHSIRFQYLTLRGPGASGASATVGVEFDDGRAGTQVVFDRAGMLTEKLAIELVPVVASEPRLKFGCLETIPLDAGQEHACAPELPFSAGIPAGLTTSGRTDLVLRMLKTFSPTMQNAVDLGRYAEITLRPSPAVPFNPTAQVCYYYSAADVLRGGGHAENLFLATFENGAWVRLPTTLQPSANLLSAPAGHFSTFGVFAEQQPEELPTTGGKLNMPPVGAGAAALLGLAAWLFRRKR